MRKMAPVHLILHFPETQEGEETLARQVSEVHADIVNQQLRSLSCPASQKLELLEAIIKTVKSSGLP